MPFNAFFRFQYFGLRLEVVATVVNSQGEGALRAFHQYFNRTIRQLENLQDVGQSTDAVQIINARIFVVGIFLCQ